MSIKVLLVDDEQMIRMGLRLILEAEDDIEVVGEAGDGREGVDLTRRLDPDVVLMDVQMPVMNGIEATREIVALGRDDSSRVLILTTFDLDEYVFEGLRAGASGFLLKRTPPADLVSGIRVVAEGDGMIAPSVTHRLIQNFRERPERRPRLTRPSWTTSRSASGRCWCWSRAGSRTGRSPSTCSSLRAP